jgi:hypothetical protein
LVTVRVAPASPEPVTGELVVGFKSSPWSAHFPTRQESRRGDEETDGLGEALGEVVGAQAARGRARRDKASTRRQAGMKAA